MNVKILVHAHVFYPDIWRDVKECIDSIAKVVSRDSVDVYITYPSGRREIEDVTSDVVGAKRIPLQNAGFDIGSFFYVISSVDIDAYDYVVKLHTKRDVHPAVYVNFRPLEGPEWRNELLSFCRTERAFRRTLAAFERQPTLGMVAGRRVIDPSGRVFNVEECRTEDLVENLSLAVKGRTCVYGTMFMARAALLRPYIGKVCFSDFIPQGPTGGYLRRQQDFIGACEYSFGMVIEAQGYFVTDGRFPLWLACVHFRILGLIYGAVRRLSAVRRCFHFVSKICACTLLYFVVVI